MKPLTRDTLENLVAQLAARPFAPAELDELVTPQLGIITGYQDLLDELEILRKTDLDGVPPAGALQGPASHHE